jgi:hypothetical protein
MSSSLKRLTNFLRQDIVWNAIVSSFLFSSIVFYIAGVATKVNNVSNNNIDVTIDFLKLLMVWANIILLTLLLFQKKILTYGACWMKALCLIGLIILGTGIIIDFSEIILEYQSSGEDQNHQKFNLDSFTLGVSFLTDLFYLSLYITFKSRRAIISTLALIITEIILLGVCAKLKSDEAIDVANLTISLITCAMGVLLWSAKVVLKADGTPLEFQDYFERDDLQDMEIMITNPGNKV